MVIKDIRLLSYYIMTINY